MVPGSILEAFQKQGELLSKLRDKDYLKILQTRLNFYNQEGNSKKAKRTSDLIWTYRYLVTELRNIFGNNDVSWKKYVLQADKYFYGKANPEWLDCQNGELMKQVVTALNSRFPEEEWEFGELPIYQSRMLNWPGREYDEEDEEAWEADGAKKNGCGEWWQSYAGDEYCIYKKKVKEQMLEAKDDFNKLIEVCNNAMYNREYYFVPTTAYSDGECESIIGRDIHINFEEGAENDWITEKPFTPQEKVINDTIVSEVDQGCLHLNEMALVHSQLFHLELKLDKFMQEGNFDKSSEGQGEQ